MAYDLKYDKLLRAIERGEQSEAVSFFERKLFDVNEGIRYLFEDGKRFVVTPLYWAVRHNCPKVCKYLLSKGARPYGTMVYEYYPLHEACSRGYEKVVQEFVNARCEMDKMNSDSDTPLHIACMRGHIQCVHILLRAGSNCGLGNKLGHTPLQCAVYHGHTDLVELFKAHNKGIETTPPISSAHPNYTTLAASGVKVQRSQSFNAPESSTSTGHAQKRGSSHLRLRNSPRPQSYYGNEALVIGQQPLSSIPQSVSMQSLSSNSSCLSSFSTISTHVQPYSKLSPDSPVELDAPKRSKDPPRPVAKVPSSSNEAACPRMFSKPVEDFVTKHGEGASRSSSAKAGEIGEPSLCMNFPPVCPFPSPGATQKDLPEKKLGVQKQPHPLSASARSEIHRHGDKPLHEQMSHPEFHITKRDVHVANRAKSSNDMFLTNSAKRETVDRAPVLSPTRQHINTLATTLCDSLEPSLSPHSSLKSSSSLHPVLMSLRLSLGSQAHRFGLSPEHHKSLSELALSPEPSFPRSSYHSVDSSSLSPLPSFQEVDYEVIEGPLESEIEEEGGGKEVYATLVYKVQICDVLVQLRSQMSQGDIAFLKVRVRLEPKSGSLASVQPTVPHMQPLPEALLLQGLPHHPNIISGLYHCCGRTERIRQHLTQKVQSTFHTTAAGNTSSQSRPNSSSTHSESGSGTTECLHGNGDSPTYNPAGTGIFLFQSLPGISLGKYFNDFLKSEQKETIVEDKFLHLLAQLLLAVAHLQKNLVSHCAINPQNVYVSDKGERVVLGNFGQALNLRPKNLDVLQKSIKRLKTNKTRKLSPEAEQGLANTGTDELSTHTLHNLEEAFRLSDSYAVGALFYDLLGKDCGPLSDSETPFIHSLSFRCNHLLQKLVARNPCDRFSALQGAISCFVLLFGPRVSDVCTTTECLRWLASESLELYLNPVLQDSSLPSNRDSNCTRRLHYTYLIAANPDLVYNSCKFFNVD